MTVETKFQEGILSYSIVSEKGSGTLLGIFHRILDAEKAGAEDIGKDTTSLTTDNYDFKVMGVTDGGLCKVAVTPRHKKSPVKECFLFIDSSGYAVRFENRLVENPSPWN
jgi:hypothetical protein